MANDPLRQPLNPVEETDRAALRYFERVSDAFSLAEAHAGGPVDHFFSVAGRTIHVRFAGEALVPCVEQALRHLAIGPCCTVDLTVSVWDTASTTVPLPAVPWRTRDQSPRGSVAGYNSHRMRTAFQGNTLSLMDRAVRQAIFWAPAPQAIPQWDVAAPLRTIFHWLIDSDTCQVVHAAAVGTTSAGALLVGKGGSGKSTTTLICLAHGLKSAGDDYVALSTAPSPRAWSLYSSAKLNRDSLDFLPQFAASVSNQDRAADEKAIIFMNEKHSGNLARSLPVQAAIVPSIAGGAMTQLVPVSRAFGLRALAPSSLLLLPDADSRAWGAMVDFARRVPCYELRIGRDSANIPVLISDLLDRLADDEVRTTSAH